MCIIIDKPAGIALPTDDRLADCWYANPDGAGYMYLNNGTVTVRKGFMSLRDLTKSLAAHTTAEMPVVIHFRIGTQGFRNAANTHPFVVTSDEKSLSARVSSGAVAIAHNGIIDLCSSWYRATSKHDEHSDTFLFVRDYASLLVHDEHYHDDQRTVTLLERLADSKLCLLGRDGHTERIGTFHLDADGCWYSNDSYQPRTLVYPSAEDHRATVIDSLYPYDIRGTFVRHGLLILDTETNVVEDSANGEYVLDQLGRVYLVDESDGALCYMPDYEAIDGEYQQQTASGNLRTFTVVDIW